METKEGNYRHPLYYTWTGMRQRCENPKATKYHNYGGRGIKVCERWQIFDNFVNDMGEKPPGTSLDRIDVNGNYEPSNCRWATPREQRLNSRIQIKDGYCTRGHKLTPENSYKRKNGYVQCRRCMALADKRYRARKNELLALAREVEAANG